MGGRKSENSWCRGESGDKSAETQTWTGRPDLDPLPYSGGAAVANTQTSGRFGRGGVFLPSPSTPRLLEILPNCFRLLLCTVSSAGELGVFTNIRAIDHFGRHVDHPRVSLSLCLYSPFGPLTYCLQPRASLHLQPANCEPSPPSPPQP